jgi:DNA anti-recombination protein RmuC
MSVKDKIIFGVLVVLIGVAGYFQYMATNMIARMDELNKKDAAHVDVVHNEFREDLRKLNLQFIGRGKHLQKAQQDIIANTKYIEYVTDSLGNAIQEVQYNLDELDRMVAKQFANVEDDIQDLTESFNRERRRSKSELAEIKQTITSMQSEIKALNDKVFGVPEEEKDKK